jgi:hypothetical protein
VSLRCRCLGLCNLSHFVIVDITNPRSAPPELQATVPDFMLGKVKRSRRLHETGEPAELHGGALTMSLRGSRASWSLAARAQQPPVLMTFVSRAWSDAAGTSDGAEVLERLREKLRDLDYMPMVFNFDRP